MRAPAARIQDPFRTPRCKANAGDLLQFHTPGNPGLNLSKSFVSDRAAQFGLSDRRDHCLCDIV
jgi:hypothetical protein